MSYLYGITDEKYVKEIPDESQLRTSELDSFKFRRPTILKKSTKFDPNDISIAFKTSPDSLLNLCAKVVDAIPLPMVYTWSIEDICRWLRQYGYPQYQNTFRENLINGRTLLLVDAAALSAMNIKNFDHIRHIAYGIRSLFFFEMTKFGRSISLAPEYHYELYKLFRVKSGRKYEMTARSDFWRQIQLIRERTKFMEHWELLERWLRFEPKRKYPEIIGEQPRFNLYRCKKRSLPVDMRNCSPETCYCMPPCECRWTERDLRAPWRISCLPYMQYRRRNSVLTVLENMFPFKYGIILKDIYDETLPSRVHKFTTNSRATRSSI